MKSHNPAAKKMLANVTAWVARQSEPFELAEVASRFGLQRVRALRITRRLVTDGLAEMVSPRCGTTCAVYRRKAGA